MSCEWTNWISNELNALGMNYMYCEVTQCTENELIVPIQLNVLRMIWTYCEWTTCTANKLKLLQMI